MNHTAQSIACGSSDRFVAAHVPTEAVLAAARPDFPEELFAPRATLCEDYRRRVHLGYARMRQQRVVIGGLARDIESVLPLTQARIECLGALFGDYRVVIYENDSADQTAPLLHAWSSGNRRVTVLSERRDDPVNRPTRCLSRAARMAYYRARCQMHIAAHYADFDQVILVDTDLAGGWSYDGVANTYGHDGWDFVGAYGVIFRRVACFPNRLAHYDAWAYRVDRDFTPLTTKQVNRMLFERGQPLQPVTSCFGGLGVYTMPAYLAGRYDGSDVEHVTFHQELHRRGFCRTYLNPSQVALYGRKHRTWDRVVARLLQVADRIPGLGPVCWQFPQAAGPAVSPPTPAVVPRSSHAA